MPAREVLARPKLAVARVLSKRETACRILAGLGLIGLVVGSFVLAEGYDVSGPILLGLATTALAAALVDWGAIKSERRRTAAVDVVAAARIGRIHQRLLQLAGTIFDVRVDDPKTIAERLRERPDTPLDLSVDAGVLPPRSKAVYAIELHNDINAEMTTLTGLVGFASASLDLAELDHAIRTSHFLSYASVFGVGSHFRNSHILAAALADIVEKVQAIMPHAQRAAGSTWRHGEWDG